MSEKKYPIKWEYKSHSYQIADTGDYDGYWEVTNGTDSLITKEDYEDIEKDLQAVVDLLNNTYANFKVDRTTEAALESEKEWLKIELEQARKPQPRPGWVKDKLPPIKGDYYCKCKVDGESKKLIVEFDKNGRWGEAPGYDCYEDFEIIEWLDESPAEQPVIDNARYELRLALRDMIKLVRRSFGDNAIPDEHQKRIEAADAMFKKHSKVTDVLRAEQPVISKDSHEKEIMMQAFDKVRQIFEGRQWIMEGRGSYPYNDDRYQQEVRYMYDEFDQVVKDTWANIKSKSADYRKAIIDEYKAAAEQPGREVAIAFAEWLNSNFISIENKDGEAAYVEYGPHEYHRKQQFKIAQLWEVFKKDNPEWSGEKEGTDE